MHVFLRDIVLCFALALLAAPAFAAPDSKAVENALQKAREKAGEAMADKQAEMPVTEEEDSERLQKTYPSIVNRLLKSGGDGRPQSAIWYPELGNDRIDATLKKFAEGMARAYTEEVSESMEGDAEKPESFSDWEQTGFFTVERPGPAVISVTFNIYSYVGGAHGQIAICVLNFELESGKRLELSDLFAEPQKALDILSAICARKLAENLGEDADDDMIKDGTEPDESNFANLSLLPDGVAVEFQPYQVGPWSIGQQHVDVSLTELAAAGPSAVVWPADKKARTPEEAPRP